ncbi:GEVED domain-containing protein [Oceanihabitans sediminis]|uniref:T9SS C-terminal target domain-containing protein n=1 Tax=Oceanihabitans sediminis TaxID=1812012 RepID=A0A368P7Q5_9FLAO|nr:GEVED domain-containing protein [Oceanihabitans sediminis]RCU57829.1 T9SS C-terminal target domain-containing protein [Oceanihabitans sediminis]
MKQTYLNLTMEYGIKHAFKSFSLVFLLLASVIGYSQTTHISSTSDGGFETGNTFAANGWTATAGNPNENQWVCDSGSTGHTGARAAYITDSRNANPPTHTYDIGTTSVSHIYRTITIPASNSNITLNFDWKGRGESSFDKMQVWLVPTIYTPTYGNKITSTGTAPTGKVQIGTNYSAQTNWINTTLIIPASYAGTTFRLVFEWSNDGSVGTNPPIAIDNISLISNVATPPSNDEPCNAIAAPVNADLNCGSVASGTLAFASNSNATTTCNGTPNDDVWFSFTATSTVHHINLNNISGSTTDLYHAVYSGDCATLNLITGTCSDPNESIVGGLTIGAIYYVQVYSWSNATHNSTFNLCIGTPPPPPANDECSGAISLTINLDDSCTATTAGTILNASNSGVNPCSGIPNDDVWYTFVATNTAHTVDLLNVTGSTTDLYHAVYANNPCTGSTTALTCSDPNNSTTTGLTIGTTYYVQVYSWSASSGATTNFDICIGTPPPCTTPNTPTGPITFGTVTDDSIAGSFNASVPTANNYLVIRSLSATPPTIANGTTYTNGQTFGAYTVVDTDNDTNFTATGLTQTTTYYFYVYAFNNDECSSGPMYSNTSLNGNATTVLPTYCIPSSTNTLDFIDDFTTSGASTNINHTASGFSPNGYGDFTSSHNITQINGGTINFTATHGSTESYQMNIWVDWNNDLDFDDANEKVFDSSAYANIINGSFIVPNTAPAGSYRMRIRTDWSSPDVSPCGYDDRSETHDYTLNVTPLNCTANPQTLTAESNTTTTATISWTHPSPQPGNGYDYIISTDNTTSTPAGDISGTTTGTTISLTGLTPGTTYYVFVRGNCNATDQGYWLTTLFATGCSDTVFTPTTCPTIIDVQGNDPFTANPFVSDPQANISCEFPTVTLKVNSNLHETSSYKVEKISYPNPAPIYDFSYSTGSQTVTTDDYWADNKTNLEFPFCYYNNTYTQTLIGANGMITFNSAINPGSSSGYSFNENLPSTAGALFEQTIYGVYHDIDPSGLAGQPIRSRIVGAAPCRQFQVSWNNIPMFSDNSILYTGMIVLHETTNIIEVFIQEKRIDNNNISPWNNGNAIVGIQGANTDSSPSNPANEYTVAPCRNGLDPNWETFNEAWRFTPNGAKINPDSVTWYSASNGGVGGIPIGTGITLNVNSEDTYFAVSQYTLCSGPVMLTDDIVVTANKKVWNGSASTDWFTSENWTPTGVPTNQDCVVIPDVATTSNRSPLVVASATSVGLGKTLLVETNGYLELLPDAGLIITDDITVDGKLILRNNSNLIQVTNTGITNAGNIQMQRVVNNLTPQDYVYWSSPVENFAVTAVSPGSNRIYKWLPTTATMYGNWQATTEIMEAAKGYIIRGVTGTNPEGVAAANTVEFTGVPRNGRLQIPIMHGGYTGADYAGAGDTDATELDDNWNLIGNPYPSSISADLFIAVNGGILSDTPDPNTPAIYGTVYVWTHATAPSTIEDPFYGDYVYNYNKNDYIGYNSTGSNPAGFSGNIAAGQAFFVLMDHNASSPSMVTFNNSMRYNNSMPTNLFPYDNSQFFRTSQIDPVLTNRNALEKHRIWLDLIAPNNRANSILVGYIENATDGIDKLYDGIELSETSTRFYSIIEDEKMAIQGKALPFEDSDTVPLGVVIPQAGNYTIAINTMDGLFENTFQDIFLEDTYTGIIHDLRVSPYSLNIDAGTYNDRFILRYTNETLSIENHNLASGLEIYTPNNNSIEIKSKSTIQRVSVYDLLGRTLENHNNINSTNFSINNYSYAVGTYIVKVTLSNGAQKSQKVVLKR